jgi:hypothetical protein
MSLGEAVDLFLGLQVARGDKLYDPSIPDKFNGHTNKTVACHYKAVAPFPRYMKDIVVVVAVVSLHFSGNAQEGEF